jgi:hypothetical protein
MPAATYASVLVRSHLWGLIRLTNEERLVLKESVAEVAAISRNLNQIAGASNQGGRLAGPTREDLRSRRVTINDVSIGPPCYLCEAGREIPF